VVAVGKDARRKTEKDIADMYEGAKVTKVDTNIAGVKTQWWHYHDTHHLYATCDVTLRDKKGHSVSVYFDLTANSPDRLAALEDSMSRI
jgi:hypothetical protein